MRNIFLFCLFTIVSFTAFGQTKHYNLKSGFIAKGYDVVAYFDNKAIEGSSSYVATHKGVKYKFANATNLRKFKADPDKYEPAYGGWCAYAMGKRAAKVNIDPTTFEIRDGKLYLFYNRFMTNTLNSWKDEGPNQLKQKADKNWLDILKK